MSKYNGEINCPNCRFPIYGHPAISRKDNKTEICSFCGTAEAFSVLQNYLYAKSKDSN